MLLISVFLFGFFIRLVFVFLEKASSSSDGMGVLSKLSMLSRSWVNNLKIADGLNHQAYFPRPNLFHYLVSRFPKKMWRLVLVFGNSVADLGVATILFLVIDLIIDDPIPHIIGVLGILVFLTTPIFFPYSARLKVANGRTFGFLLTSLYLVGIFLIDVGAVGIPLWLWVGILSVILMLVIWTSTFATQAALFIGLVYTLLSLNWLLVLPLILCLLVGFLIPQLKIKDLLLFKWHHTLYYAKVQMNSYSTRMRGIFNFYKIFLPGMSRTERMELFLKHSPVLILIHSLPILFFIPIDFWNGFALFSDNIESGITRMLFSVLVVFLLTSIGKGKLFGESERYLEYGVFPIILILLFSDADQSSLLMIAMLHLSLIVFLSILNEAGALQKLLGFGGTFPEGVREIIKFINSRSEEKKILCVPIRLSRALSSYTTEEGLKDFKYYYRLVVSGDNMNDFLSLSIEEMHDQNVPSKNAQYFNDVYGVNYIVVDKRFRQNEFYVTLQKSTEKILDAEAFEVFLFRN